MMRRLLPILALALVIALTASAALACPMCKDSVPSSDAQAVGGVPSGFNNSIFLMLGGLFLVMGFIGFTIIRGIHSTPSARAARGFPVDSTPA